MARTKGTSEGKISLTTRKRLQPVWQIGMLFPDGKKIVKPKCTLNELMETYFINLDKFIGNYTPEQLVELYKKTFQSKGIKVQINYIDSYAHKWTGKVAWPKQERFIEYLNKRIND